MKTADIDLSAATEIYRRTGKTAAVAEGFGISLDMARKALKLAGVDINKTANIPAESFLKLFEAGLGVSEIAGRLGVSKQTARSRLVKAGVLNAPKKKEWGKGLQNPKRAAFDPDGIFPFLGLKEGAGAGTEKGVKTVKRVYPYWVLFSDGYTATRGEVWMCAGRKG